MPVLPDTPTPITVRVPLSLKRKIRVLAATKNITIQDFITSALEKATR